MPDIKPPSGVIADNPRVTTQPYYSIGYNVRFRLGSLETIGLFGPVRDINGDQIQLAGANQYRFVSTEPAEDTVQIIAGSSSHIQLIDFDVASTSGTGTRLKVTDITPALFDTIPDTIPNPSTGGVVIPPNVSIAVQGKDVVILKANDVGSGPYLWDRDPASQPTVIADAPTGAVALAITDNILVLIGCGQQGGPAVDPERFLNIGWSDFRDYGAWDPVAAGSVSGFLSVDSGNRLVGGGLTRFGVLAWTDEALWQLNPIPTQVFKADKVTGSTGMISNQAWTELGNSVFWMDQNRHIMVYDGGAPRPMDNPLKTISVERMSDAQVARVYAFAVPEFNEIVFAYPDDDPDNPDRQLVFNTVENAWSLWLLPRTGWTSRKASTNAVAVDHTGLLWQHDLDIALPDKYLTPPSIPLQGVQTNADPLAADVEPFDYMWFTNLITLGEVTSTSGRSTRVHFGVIEMPADGAEDDQIDFLLIGYGEAQVDSEITTDRITANLGDLAHDFRVGGKALQLGSIGEGIKTVLRFDGMTITAAGGGAR